MSAPGWHPAVVHFPLALIVSAALLLIGARLAARDSAAATLATVGTWNLCLGAVTAVLALASGLAAVLDLNVSEAAHLAISLHAKWAMFASLAVVLLAVWRGAGTAPDSRPSWLFVMLLAAAALALLATGYRGGENVYRYGIGVLGTHGS